MPFREILMTASAEPRIARGPRSFENERTGRAYINFLWLWKLRWAAVIGQLTTVVAAQFFFGVDLPVVRLVLLIGITVVTNLIFGSLFGRALRDNSLSRFGSEGEWLMGLAGITDILVITLLLQATGGEKNPFSVFFLVNLVLLAIILPSRWAFGLTTVAAFGYASLYVFGEDLQVFRDPESLPLLKRGGLIAFVLAAAIVVYFVIHVREELQNLERELDRARQRRAQSQRIEAMVTLAAGAAHELSTPLSTIAVIAKELERELVASEADSAQIDDVELIRREVRRCRTILEQMSADSGEMVGESVEQVLVPVLIADTLEPLHAEERVDLEVDEQLSDALLEGPLNALRRALRGLVKNALDATSTPGRIRVRARLRGGRFHFEVVDRGDGMTPETLARSEDPFFTTKDPGRGMGLGLFLTRSVIERLGGSLEIKSRLGAGTTAHVSLPLAVQAEPQQAPT